jgi:hypothetical protein
VLGTGSLNQLLRQRLQILTVTSLVRLFVGMGSIVSDKILPPHQAWPGVSRRITYTIDRTVPGPIPTAGAKPGSGVSPREVVPPRMAPM